MRSPTVAGRFPTRLVLCASFLLFACSSARAQVFVVQAEHVEQKYSQVTPTSVALTTDRINDLGRQELIRFLQSERGFAMRPLPVGIVTLVANGPMQPAGQKYIDLLHKKGICAKPGDPVVVTNIKIHDKDITFDFNGGPYHRHRFLRHIAVGMGDVETPLAQDDATIPSGFRVILQFRSGVPNISGQQVQELLRPMVNFGKKSAGEAYAESLPPFLRRAIVEHRVLIGMDRDMVLHSKGEPVQKIREKDADGKSFVVWVYGEVPQPVEFVRFVDSFVVRDEVARVGTPMLVRTANEMGNYWGTQPVVAANEHEVQLGDRSAAQLQQESAPKAPPTLRAPGETLPADSEKNKQPVMAPVNFPKDQQRPGDPNYTPPQTTASPQPAAGSQPASTGSQPGSSTTPASTNPLDQPSGPQH